jgi:hypothetical protein
MSYLDHLAKRIDGNLREILMHIEPRLYPTKEASEITGISRDRWVYLVSHGIIVGIEENHRFLIPGIELQLYLTKPEGKWYSIEETLGIIPNLKSDELAIEIGYGDIPVYSGQRGGKIQGRWLMRLYIKKTREELQNRKLTNILQLL